MMSTQLLLVIGLITVALTFDYINGFHDAANSIATIVSTRVLTPRVAVAWAAFFNFVAAFGFGTAVAKTIGSGMIDATVVTFAVIFSGLMGAIIWKKIIGFPPGTTQTCDAFATIPRVSETCAAIASRSSGNPCVGP